jgi:anti-sigma-K factor RskA
MFGAMSDSADHNGLPEDELIAAEYALGVLSGAERDDAERRVAREAAFANLVAVWEERLAPWASEIAEVTPAPGAWDAIVAALPAPPPKKAGLWNSIAFWRGFALASAVAAACLVAVFYFGAVGRNEPLVAAIDGGGHHHFVATVDIGRGTIAVAPAAFVADATRVPELWLIPSDGKPRPLGLLRADRIVAIAVPADLAPLTVKNAVLAVSLEPPGGSPTGQPTGPVIATGKLENL